MSGGSPSAGAGGVPKTTAGNGSGGGGGGAPAGGTGGASEGVALDPLLLSRCSGSSPIRCTIPVPANGNYQVTVELGSDSAASVSRVQAELYRIVVPPVSQPSGGYSRHTFAVNVRSEVHDDYSADGMELDLLIDGDAPALRGIGVAPVDVPTLFVIGDSTVCDWDPAYAASNAAGPLERGWAQELSQYFGPQIAIANYADSGDTASSLYGKFERRGAELRAGDFLFIQFGHNDQKTTGGRDAYQANLMKFVNDARAKQATPVLFSPVGRKGASLSEPGFQGLDQQARDLAKAENIAFIDLTKLSIEYYATVPNKAVLFATPSEGTHFSETGATAIAGLVAGALARGTVPPTSVGTLLK